MAITFDYENNLINITSPQDTLSCQDLIDAIRTEEASATGTLYPQIATASGKEDLGAGVEVGITVNLISPWQLKWWSGEGIGGYIAKIAGGNLVGGINNDPVAYSPGVQVLLVQSAASTIVTEGGSVPSASEVATAVWDNSYGSSVVNKTEYSDKILNNKRTISKEGSVHYLIVYDDDGTTEILKKALKDINGSNIADISEGILAMEAANSA